MIIRSYLYLFLFLSLTVVNAQVGVGTTSPNATLDIRSSNQAVPANTDGMLIPKIDTFPIINPTALQQGMLVFLTTAAGANQPGFYYWNNPTTSWIGVGSTLTNNWSLTGNTATSSGTNFIGTTDDVDLTFKRFGIKSGFIGNPNTATGNMNTSFGANSLLNPGATGIRNVAIGTNVMPSITSGNRNVSIGDQSMFLNTTGTENTVIGVGAMYSSAFGVCNVAIGRNALTNTNGLSGTQGSNNTGIGYVSLRTNTIGAYNSALGRESLFTNLSGNYNVGVGYQSGFTNSTGSNNVFLGTQAGYNETGSSKLYIESSNADATTALVYGEFASSPKVLRTNSQFQIGDPAGTGYKFPTARGTANQVLQTDGTGTLTWTNGVNKLSTVRVNLGANQSIAPTGWQKLSFDGVVFDTNTEFDTTQNRFVAANAGYYRITAGYHTDNQPNTSFYSIGVRVNGVFYQETSSKHYGADIVSRQISCIVKLNATDFVEIFENNTQGSVIIDGYSGKTYFEIEQIRGL